MEKYIGRVVEIIYINDSGKITQRKIRVNSIENGIVRAYCFQQRGPRVFKIGNILATYPIRRQA
jgi:predicted DNA-binding transcriptional regulator YafY